MGCILAAKSFADMPGPPKWKPFHPEAASTTKLWHLNFIQFKLSSDAEYCRDLILSGVPEPNSPRNLLHAI
ncbi:hypothetical protein TNCV_1232631 [Trichonephila clavipes]|nr:hypothetical protein TNCV_1232631 [Trichonephila clavipes]